MIGTGALFRLGAREKRQVAAAVVVEVFDSPIALFYPVFEHTHCHAANIEGSGRESSCDMVFSDMADRTNRKLASTTSSRHGICGARK
jgi:hypothetical protein